jgi:hypothetical protein
MSYSWLEGLEEYINNVIETNKLDPVEAWKEVAIMAIENGQEQEVPEMVDEHG